MTKKLKTKYTNVPPARLHAKEDLRYKETTGKWLEDYTNFRSFKQVPLLDASLERIAADLIHWAEHDKDAIKIAQFYLKLGVSNKTWSNWTQRYPIINEAMSIAKEFIGVRRELRGLKREYEPNHNLAMMHLYDSNWKEAAEWRAQLKALSQQDATKANVIVLSDLEFKEKNMVPPTE